MHGVEDGMDDDGVGEVVGEVVAVGGNLNNKIYKDLFPSGL